MVVLKQNHAQDFRIIFSAFSYTIKYFKSFKTFLKLSFLQEFSLPITSRRAVFLKNMRKIYLLFCTV